MISKSRLTAALIVFFACIASAQEIQKTVEVSPTIADQHILKKIAPQYPEVAKSARLQGTVLLKVAISPEGKISHVGVVSGHPMLVTAAISAVKQWEYKPFMVDDHAAAVSTMVEIPFSLGISEAEYKKEQESADAYFQQENKCRQQLNQNQYSAAEESCKSLSDLVEKLPVSRRMERVTAYQYLGHSFFVEKRFSDALAAYQHELKIAEEFLGPTDAELGYAYRDVARAFHGTGELHQARSYYDRAEITLEQAQEHIGSAFLKNKYAATIKAVLQEKAILLRRIGDELAATAADQKASSIVVRTDLKD